MTWIGILLIFAGALMIAQDQQRKRLEQQPARRPVDQRPVNRGEVPPLDERTLCPRCESLLVPRTGPYGEFWGCTSYPDCRYTRNR